MIYIFMLVLIGGGQAGAPIQQIAPPSGGISPLAWTIILALTTALVAVSKIGWSIYGDLKETRAKLEDVYEEPAQLLKALRVGLEMPTPHPPPPAPPSEKKEGGQP
jgi:hypothetical protein